MFIVKYADGASSRPFEKIVVLNSAVVFDSGVAKLSAGGVDGADAVTDAIYGIVKGFVVDGGNTPIDNALSGQYDGTYSAGVSYTAAADNQTDKKVQALVEPVLPGDIIRVEADATLGTTTGSDLIGYYGSILTTNERVLDESTVSDSQQQLLIVGQPNKGDFVDVKLVENQMTGNTGA